MGSGTNFVLNGTAGALHMHHRAARDGSPTLAFSNSLGTDFRVWDGLVATLPDDWGIVRYDSRGHGLSSLGKTPYTIDDHLADLLAVLDAAGVAKVVLVGLSVGGLIGQAFALSAPDRLSGLVLMCTAAKVLDEARWHERIAIVEESGLEPLLEGNMERWFTPAFRTPDNALYEGMCTMFRRQSPAAYVATCATLRDTDLRDEVARIRLPVLAIAGEADGSTPPDIVEGTAERIDGARFVELSGAGHIPCVEVPDAVAAVLIPFVREATGTL